VAEWWQWSQRSRRIDPASREPLPAESCPVDGSLTPRWRCREREGIPGGRADELLEVLERLSAAVDILGPPAFGVLRLLAHWATQSGGLKVNEDELLAEIRTVGGDEWEQATAEAERSLEELTRLGRPGGEG
jgi:hypothetical protein